MTDTTAHVRRRCDRIAGICDWADLNGVRCADARARAIELLGLRPGDRVLDVACGTGANPALIRPSGHVFRHTRNASGERFTWGWAVAAAGAKAAA